MCVILVAPTVEELLSVDLDRAWNYNSHGAGIVFRRANRTLRKIKGIMSLKHLENILLSIPGDIQGIVLHMRIATHGKVNRENTHPFKAGENCFLFHNGCISGLGSTGRTTESSSDSAHMARILSYLPYDEKIPLLQAVGGKYVLMTPDSTMMIGNFEQIEKTQVHASNTHWMLRHYPIVSTYTQGKGWQHPTYWDDDNRKIKKRNKKFKTGFGREYDDNDPSDYNPDLLFKDGAPLLAKKINNDFSLDPSCDPHTVNQAAISEITDTTQESPQSVLEALETAQPVSTTGQHSEIDSNDPTEPIIHMPSKPTMLNIEPEETDTNSNYRNHSESSFADEFPMLDPRDKKYLNGNHED